MKRGDLAQEFALARFMERVEAEECRVEVVLLLHYRVDVPAQQVARYLATQADRRAEAATPADRQMRADQRPSLGLAAPAVAQALTGTRHGGGFVGSHLPPSRVAGWQVGRLQVRGI